MRQRASSISKVFIIVCIIILLLAQYSIMYVQVPLPRVGMVILFILYFSTINGTISTFFQRDPFKLYMGRITFLFIAHILSRGVHADIGVDCFNRKCVRLRELCAHNV